MSLSLIAFQRDGRSVEHETIVEHVFIDDARHHGQVLPLALGIGEAQIDPLDLLLLDHA